MKDENSVPAAQKMTDVSLSIFRSKFKKTRIQMIDYTFSLSELRQRKIPCIQSFLVVLSTHEPIFRFAPAAPFAFRACCETPCSKRRTLQIRERPFLFPPSPDRRGRVCNERSHHGHSREPCGIPLLPFRIGAVRTKLFLRRDGSLDYGVLEHLLALDR